MKSGRYSIPLLYIALGITWILLSDQAMSWLHGLEPGKFEMLNTGKGVVYVFLTGLLLYVMINRVQNRLVRSELQYRKLYEDNPNPIWFYDPDTYRFISVNDAAIAVYGYTRKEFLSMSVMDIRPAEDEDKLKDLTVNLSETFHGKGVWRHLKKGGGLMYANITSYKTSLDGKDVVMVMALDTTEKIEFENQLQEANTQLRKQTNQLKRLGEILNKITNPVTITSPQGIITWVNPAFTAISGYSPEECIGKSHAELLFGPQTDPKTIEEILLAAGKCEAISIEILHYNKAGTSFWISLNLSPIFDIHGELECYISVENDISERKEKEAQIARQNERLKVVSWLNSHQIRRPVASILALVELIQLCKDQDEKDELLDKLNQSTRELDEIIHQINTETSGNNS